MGEYLRFENAIVCSGNCSFFEIFCSVTVFITDFFRTFLFLIMHLQSSIELNCDDINFCGSRLLAHVSLVAKLLEWKVYILAFDRLESCSISSMQI